MSHTEVDKIEVISSFLSFSKSEYEQVESCIETTEFDIFTKEMKSSFLWCLGDFATNYLLDFDVIFSSDLSFELDEIFTSQEFPSYLKTPKIIPKAKLYRDVEPNDELIQEDRLRLELYRRLSFVQNVQEVYDIELEIADRFGKLDIITRQFIDITIIKVLAREQGILKISNFNENILIEYSDKKETLKASSRDDDDIINCVKNFF